MQCRVCERVVCESVSKTRLDKRLYLQWERPLRGGFNRRTRLLSPLVYPVRKLHCSLVGERAGSRCSALKNHMCNTTRQHLADELTSGAKDQQPIPSAIAGGPSLQPDAETASKHSLLRNTAVTTTGGKQNLKTTAVPGAPCFFYLEGSEIPPRLFCRFG